METRATSPSRIRSFACVAWAYAVAIAAAFLVAARMTGRPAWQVVALADLAATLVIFASSMLANNSSMYDPYWSVAPIVIAPALAAKSAVVGVPHARVAMVIALVVAWGVRLTWNWARGWQGLRHEDWRYVDLRRATGRAYWLVSLLGLHLMPTVWVYLGCLSLLPAIRTGTHAIGVLDGVALVVTAFAIALEALSDAQLRVFRASHTAGDILVTGAWAHSRHPNYLGEIAFWWGLFLFALASDPHAWWFIAGPLSITALFVFISVPMLDKRSLARRPGYAEHARRVPALLPRPWRRAAPAERGRS